MALSRRQKKYFAGWGIMLSVTAVIGMVCAAVIYRGKDMLTPEVMIVVATLLAGLAMLACIPWWRALDEMQKDAQLAAWYWGGTMGVTIGLLSAVIIGGPHSELVKGAVLVGGAQGVCFAVVWLGWRVIHRPRAS